MKKHAPQRQLPVSKNFYASVIDRVRGSLNLIGRSDAVAETMDCINRYMADGTVPPVDTDPAVALTFALLRAELDKAVERSRRARSRGARQSLAAHSVTTETGTRTKTVSESASIAEAETDSDAESEADPEPFVPRNRRERRLYEQEVRRAARRLTRRLAASRTEV